VAEVTESAALPGLPLPSFGGGVHLIQGPPGTGKTSTIARLVLCLAGAGTSVLVCAPTNVACQEIALRLLKELPK
jgi:superfamily II DNA or RNA helicase